MAPSLFNEFVKLGAIAFIGDFEGIEYDLNICLAPLRVTALEARES